MTKQKKVEQKVIKEKLFKDIQPRSRVQLERVKLIRKTLANLPADLPDKIISYQKVSRDGGEYFLHYQGNSKLQPLIKYLRENSISAKKLIKEYEELLKLIKNQEIIKDIFPAGINAANFWIDEQEKIYLMPEVFLQTKKRYQKFDFELAAKEYFRPPEIIRGGEWDQKSYIFNLTAVFYYFLSGRKIFNDQDSAKVMNKIQSAKILEIKNITPQISNSLNKILMKNLNKKDSKRMNLDHLLETLPKEIPHNDFLLTSFEEREKEIDKKMLAKNNKKENIKLFFRQSWKAIIFSAAAVGIFIWSIMSGPGATITPENTPREVVDYFYMGISEKNITLSNEAVDFDLGNLDRLISETHVIERMQQAYGGPEQEGEQRKNIFNLENIEIKEVAKTDLGYEFKAHYDFKMNNPDENISFAAEDKLFLEKVDDTWRIIKIKGDIKEMIAGSYPWEE